MDTTDEATGLHCIDEDDADDTARLFVLVVGVGPIGGTGVISSAMFVEGLNVSTLVCCRAVVEALGCRLDLSCCENI